MEENNRKGPGIFYAVVGVATLVVAIVGATFAYFTASGQSDNTITGQTTTTAGVTLAVTQEAPTGLLGNTGRMVPLTSDLVETAFTKGCKDDNGYVACQVYKIVVTNSSQTEAVLSTTSLKLDASKVTDLRWQTMSDETTLTGIAVSEHTQPTNIAEKATIAAGQTATYYVGVWMHDDEDKQDEQAGQSFTGTVSANVVNADGSVSNNVTAVFGTDDE